jgi:hypothetical protein
MRAFAINAVIAASFFYSFGSAAAQQKYDLFPEFGDKHGYPPVISYHAWVISYKDNQYYLCVGSYNASSPTTPNLNCSLGGSFDPPLLNGADIRTVQALGGPRAARGTEEALSAFFWQIDQTNGKVQFCTPLQKLNCAAFQIH